MWRVVIWDREPARGDVLSRALASIDRDAQVTAELELLLARAAESDLVVAVDPDAEFVRRWKEPDARGRGKLLALIDLARPKAVWFAVLLRADRVVSLDRPTTELTDIARALLAKPAEISNKAHAQTTSPTTADPGHRLPDDVFTVIRGVCQEVNGLQRRFEAELAERRRVEQALLESEAFYQSLVAALPLAMFRKDLQGRITFVNKVLCEAMRRPASQIIGRNDYDFFPRELADQYRADDRCVIETGRNLETDEEFLTPSGERRILHSIKTPVYDASGQLVGIQGIFSDITDQRRAEFALEQERSRLDSLMQNLPDLIWFKDVDGRYLRVNPALARIWNLRDPEDAIGLTDADVFSAEFAQQLRTQDAGVLATGEPLVALEERMVLRDGRVEWVSTTRLPLNDAAGNRIGTFGVSRDISQMKQTQDVLHQAKEAAESANRAKSDFLANMSHEIRTPLNAVIGLTELLLDHETGVTQREYLRMVRDAGESLLAVVEDILDYSKIEAGKLLLEQINFSLRDEVGNTMKSLALRAHHKRLELACHIGLDVPDDLEGDPHRLRQVLFNLVGNALKFTERGEVLLDVTLERQTDDEIELHFVVRDTGIGVPAEKLAAIFQPFEQADSSTTRRYGGTGLGLGIASRLIEMMHGRIWVESLEQLGSHFHFTATFGRGNTNLKDPPLPGILNDLSVLVVDDNTTSRGILVEMLTAWGLKPIVASGTAEAIVTLHSLAESGSPCGVVLVDSQMPGEDGFQLAARLKQQPQLCPNTVMMLTAGDNPDDIARCQRLGVAGYVIKPVKQSELLEAVVSATMDVESAPTPLPAVKRPARSLNILLAEDSPMNQKLAIGLLERWGHDVTVAENGLIAVSLVRERRFDVVLMDVQMPEMDGLEATRVIRKEEPAFGQPRVPIVAMTAHAMPGDRERCLAAGMDDYVRKPIRADALFRALEDATAMDVAALVADLEAEEQNGADSLIDLSTSLAAVNHDQELLRQVMEAFLEEAPVQLQRLQAAWSAGQWTDARRFAHTLKGGLLTFGADDVAQLARTLELSTQSSTPPDDPPELPELNRQTRLVLAELQRYLNSPANDGTMS